MKVFLFQPHPDWSCCGGGMAVVAESIERAREVVKEEHDEFKLEITPDEGEGWHHWTLVAIVEAPEEKEEHIIFCDYNWA